MPEGEATSSASEEKANQGLWNLLPSFDPSVDNAKEYSDKVKFLWGICPAKDRPMLCKGTAWSQVKSIDPTKLTEAEGYKVLLGALSTWEESAELQTYDLFEKAFYKTLQKQDETTMSYVNRINVAFTEVGEDTTVKQVKAFVLLRQSGLSAEDKKRVIAMADGYDPTKMGNAMRALSTKVLSQGEVSRKKIYPINYVDEDAEEINQLHDDEPDEESVMAALLEEGDESAMVVQEFEENIIQVCQDSPELAMAFSAYQDARARLRDKARNRGFWPLRQGGKAKGKSKKGTGKGFGKNRQTLAERIANSNCRICGMRGYWRQECPQRDRQSPAADANLLVEENGNSDTELVSQLPTNVEISMWQAGSESSPIFDLMPPECHLVHDEFVFMTSHVLHESKCLKSKFGELSTNKFRQVFKKALETGFSVVRSPTAECEHDRSLVEKGTGIIDTGASKTVIGEKRVKGLLATLPESHQKLVRWQKSETVFRFGNNGTLKSLGAVYVPFGKRWLKIEVVQGWTPFLISNAFLSALEADLQISRAVLKISQWGVEVKLHRNNKGLFTVALTELIEAASEIEGRPQGEEVITLTCNESTYRSKEVYCSLQQQQKQTPAAEVAQPQSERDPNFRNSSDLSLGVSSHGAAEGNVSEQGRGDLCYECGPQSRDAPDSQRGSEFEFRSRANCPASTSTRSDQSATMGRDEVARGQVERTFLCGGISPRQQVCELHGLSQQTHVSMGPELSPICSSSPSSRSRPQGQDVEDRAREGTPSTPAGCNSNHGGTPALSSGMGTALHAQVSGSRSEESEQSWADEEKCHRGGRTNGYAIRSGKGDQGGQDGAPCDPAARGGQDSAGDWEQEG